MYIESIEKMGIKMYIATDKQEVNIQNVEERFFTVNYYKIIRYFNNLVKEKQETSESVNTVL